MNLGAVVTVRSRRNAETRLLVTALHPARASFVLFPSSTVHLRPPICSFRDPNSYLCDFKALISYLLA
jgi:hypothetical protein